MKIYQSLKIHKFDDVPDRLLLLTLCLVVLSVYLPTLFAETSLLDDRDAINGLGQAYSLDLKSLFIPKSKDGGYYRPFIGLFYFIDCKLWSFHSIGMHFENVLIHLINVLLIFKIGMNIYREQIENSKIFTFTGSLIFALHPICTESVNWISGRTDSLACVFVLLALLCVVKYKRLKRIFFLLAGFILIILGALAKETALGFIPGAVFILLANTSSLSKTVANSTFADNKSCSLKSFIFYTTTALITALIWVNYYLVVVIGIAYLTHCHINSASVFSFNKVNVKKLGAPFMVLGTLILFVIIFWLLRKIAFTSDVSKISETLKLMFEDMNYTIKLFMGAAGFYVKKFFIPVPLNLAIREIDPTYDLFGIICFFISLFLIKLKKIESALIIAGFLVLAPAFPIAFGTIAWTAFAERYNYIPSSFWVLGCIGGVHLLSNTIGKKLWYTFKLFIFLYMLVFATITVHRNILWQKNITIFKDTVNKTPEFKNIRGLYITSLYEDKLYEEAERQYLIASKLYSLKYDESYDLVYASLLIMKKRYSEAENIYDIIRHKTKGKSIQGFKAEISYYDSRIAEETESTTRYRYRIKKINALENLFLLDNAPDVGLELCQSYIDIGNIQKAQKTAMMFFENATSGTPIKQKAAEFLNLIKRQQSTH